MNIVRSIISSRNITLVTGFVIAMSIGANISIPFYPVPFTMQTAILMLAILYDKKIALLSTLAYLGFALLGLPVLQNFATGLHLLALPSAGYILGFVLATFIVFIINTKNQFINLIIANCIIFTCGIFYLSMFIGIHSALYYGGIIFIVPELIKIILANFTYKYIK